MDALYFLVTSWDEWRTPGGDRSRCGTAAWASGAASLPAPSPGCLSCAAARRTSRGSSTPQHPRCSSRSRSVASATTSTRNYSASRPPSPGRYASTPPIEIVWNLTLAGALVWHGHHRRIRPGGLFALYVAGYSAFRIFEELLRIDPAHRIIGLRLNFFIASLLSIAGLTAFLRIQRPTTPIPTRGRHG